MTTRDIQAYVKEVYGANISPAMVSMITNRVMEVARAWQNRPLDSLYVAVFFDAIFFKVRENGKIVSKAVYSCLAINSEGKKEILGFCIAGSEGATHWLNVFNNLKERGVEDILIACVDGLPGLDDAVQTAFPQTEVQRCVVHLMRNSMSHLPKKHRKEFAADAKEIYTALSENAAKEALNSLLAKWESKYPQATNCWKSNWEHIVTFFKYPEELRRVIYTTNPVEALHRQLRKVTKNRGMFPHDDSLFKLLYLAGVDIEKKFPKQINDWEKIEKHLQIIFKGRFAVQRN